MSHLNRISLWCQFASLAICLLACDGNKTQKSTQNLPDEKTLLSFSQQQVGKKAYQQLYLRATDTLKSWCDNRLTSSIELWYYKYRLDSLMCVNTAKDKVVGALLIPCNKADCKQDDIRYFYGAKVNMNWYFFYGPTMVLPQQQAHVSRSFSTLHQEAMQHIFRAYLKQDAGGQWQINETFFGDISSVAFCAHCQTQAEWDSTYIQLSRNIWKYGRSAPVSGR